MSQILTLQPGQHIKIDRQHVDGGIPPKRAVVGGQIVTVEDGRRPLPTIYEANGAFFHADRSPITSEAQIEHLPAEAKARAKKFLASQGRKPAEPLKVIKRRKAGKPRALAETTKGRRIVANDADLEAVTGGVTVE